VKLFKVAYCQRLLNHRARCNEQLMQLETIRNEIIEKQVLQQEAYPVYWLPKFGHPWGSPLPPPQNSRRPVRDVAEPLIKISRRSVKRRLRNL